MLRSRRFGNLGPEQATCCMICISCKDSGFCKSSVHMLTKVTPGQCQGEHEVARPVSPGCRGLGANQGIVFCDTDSRMAQRVAVIRSSPPSHLHQPR